jgi:D-alanine-D-alanine ligase
MKKLRVLAFMHEDLVPPDRAEDIDEKKLEECRTEYDVVSTLRAMGHEVRTIGVRDELAPLGTVIQEWKPEIAFNILEEFHGKATNDYLVVSYLELLKVPYTGCSPRGLILARDKALSKKILAYHRIRTPDFAVFPVGRKVKRPRKLEFPLIVKSLVEEASLGIAQASLVDSDEKLAERVGFIHESIRTDAIAEKYIEGRELYVGVLGNQRLRVLPLWELLFTNMPPDAPLIATAKIKWDKTYQKKRGIESKAAKDLPEGVAEHIERLSRRIYRLLELNGYARLDYRLSPAGEVFFIEANPNPQIAKGEDLADSAKAAGLSYEALLRKVISIGLRGREV